MQLGKLLCFVFLIAEFADLEETKGIRIGPKKIELFSYFSVTAKIRICL